MHLVIGGTGLVGGALRQALERHGAPVSATRRSRQAGILPLAIEQRNAVDRIFDQAKPLVAYLTAALTYVDYCEDHPEEAWRINVEGTLNVVEACLRHGTKLVFFSTDYLFDGRAGPYAEDAEPRPLNVYGRTKLEGERLVAGLPEHLIVRTTVVFAPHEPKNFVTRLVQALRRGEAVRVPNDQWGNPTLAGNLAAAVVELVRGEKNGVYNVAGKTWLPRSDFAAKVAEALGLDSSKIAGVDTASLRQKAPRPLKGGFDVRKAERELRTRLLAADEAIAAFRQGLESG